MCVRACMRAGRMRGGGGEGGLLKETRRRGGGGMCKSLRTVVLIGFDHGKTMGGVGGVGRGLLETSSKNETAVDHRWLNRCLVLLGWSIG